MLKPLQTPRLKRAACSLPVLYSACFLLLALVILWVFHISGRTFLWVTDGAYQHYIAFSRLCDALKALPSGGLPHFDFALGQGADFFTTLGPYSLTDPVNVFCALLFPFSRLTRYTLMIFIKLWLIGISFLFFCRHWQKGSRPAVLAGALLYTFSGAILFTFARHPIHIGWAYHFPFLCGSVEIFRKKGKGLPLVLAVFFNMLSSYYTTYINGLLLFFYILITGICAICDDPAPGAIRRELSKMLKMLGLALCGLLMASFILLPAVYAYMHNARMGASGGYTASALHYPASYYKQLIYSLFAAHYEPGDYYTFTGLSGLLLLPIVILYVRKGGDRRLRLLLAFSFLLILIPLAGRLLNGMSYASNRFCYIIPFYASLALVSVWESLRKMSVSRLILPGGIVLLYLALCFFLLRMDGMHIRLYYSVFFAALLCLGFLAASRSRLAHPLPWLGALAMISCAGQIILTFHPRFGNYAAEFLPGRDYRTVYEESSALTARGLSGGFYRVEQQEALANLEAFAGINGTSSYWSLTDGSKIAYLTSLAVNDNWDTTFTYGLDKREGLTSLASVRYYTRKTDEENAFLYGYEEKESVPQGNTLYENQLALPLGYIYKRALPLSEFEKLDALDKEQAMLEAAVLEKLPEGFPKHSFYSVKRRLESALAESNGVKLSEGELISEKPGASLAWELNVPEGSVLYLHFGGLRLEPETDYVIWDIMREQDGERFQTAAKITSDSYTWPVKRDELAIRLGALPGGHSRVAVSFTNPAALSFDSMNFYAVPEADYERAVRALRENVLEDILMGKDEIRGRVSLKEDAILQLSIPFNGGWQAEADGEKAKLTPSDLMYTALPLSAGNHEIVLRYHTPWLLPGIILSLVSAGGAAAACIIGRRKKKSTPPPANASCESSRPESDH